MPDKGKCATASCPTELRELADANDGKKGRGKERK